MMYRTLLTLSASTLLLGTAAWAQQGDHQSAPVEAPPALERHQQAVEAFNAHDADAVVDLYAAQAVLHDPQQPEPVRGRDAIREGYAQMFRSFPDIRVNILNRHVEGDLMMYEIRLTGTNKGPIPSPDGDIPPTGRRIDLPGAVFADLDAEGRFRETRRYYDVAEMMRQLGLDDAEKPEDAERPER
jgi:steroid delta-isomerase-like uncharacterized protein